MVAGSKESNESRRDLLFEGLCPRLSRGLRGVGGLSRPCAKKKFCMNSLLVDLLSTYSLFLLLPVTPTL